MSLPANALMTTQGTYTGQNMGAGKPERVISGAKQTVAISELFSVCLILIVLLFAEPIVTLFGLEEEAIGYAVSYVRCIAVCLIPFASYFPLLGLFQGANNALYSTFVATSVRSGIAEQSDIRKRSLILWISWNWFRNGIW